MTTQSRFSVTDYWGKISDNRISGRARQVVPRSDATYSVTTKRTKARIHLARDWR